MDRGIERRAGWRSSHPLALLLAASSLGACGATAPPSSSPAVVTAAPSVITATQHPPSPIADAGGGSAPSPTAALLVDPGLLETLPAAVGGVPVAPLPETASSVVADPALVLIAERLAVGYAASADRADWAVAWVVALRPGVLASGADPFRGWRDTYDAGACEPQGGAAGHAEATIGGRPVFITTCGPLTIHHVRLEGPDRLVAVTSTGPRRFGEAIAAALRP